MDSYSTALSRLLLPQDCDELDKNYRTKGRVSWCRQFLLPVLHTKCPLAVGHSGCCLHVAPRTGFYRETHRYCFSLLTNALLGDNWGNAGDAGCGDFSVSVILPARSSELVLYFLLAVSMNFEFLVDGL